MPLGNTVGLLREKGDAFPRIAKKRVKNSTNCEINLIFTRYTKISTTINMLDLAERKGGRESSYIEHGV